MNMKLWFILLPCLATAEIVVEVVTGDDSPEVLVRGSESGYAVSADADAFQLTNAAVKQNLKRLGWSVGAVNIMHASVHGHRDLNITLKAVEARIQRNNERTIKIQDTRIKGNFNNTLEIVESVAATLKTKWYDTNGVSIGHIRHILGYNRLEHVSVFGQEDFASKNVLMKAIAEVVQPVQAYFAVKETTLEVRVDYELSLDGDISFEHYCIPKVEYCFKESKMDVRDYFKQLNYSPVLESHEVITFTYCHDPKVVTEAAKSL